MGQDPHTSLPISGTITLWALRVLFQAAFSRSRDRGGDFCAGDVWRACAQKRREGRRLGWGCQGVSAEDGLQPHTTEEPRSEHCSTTLIPPWGGPALELLFSHVPWLQRLGRAWRRGEAVVFSTGRNSLEKGVPFAVPLALSQQPSPQLWDVHPVTPFPIAAREPRAEAELPIVSPVLRRTSPLPGGGLMGSFLGHLETMSPPGPARNIAIRYLLCMQRKELFQVSKVQRWGHAEE